MEEGQGLPTSQPAGRHPPGSSSWAEGGTCRHWDCKMEVVEEEILAAGGSFHAWAAAPRPHRVEDYHF